MPIESIEPLDVPPVCLWARETELPPAIWWECVLQSPEAGKRNWRYRSSPRPELQNTLLGLVNHQKSQAQSADNQVFLKNKLDSNCSLFSILHTIMYTHAFLFRAGICLIAAWCCCVSIVRAQQSWGGTFSNWPSTWTAVPGLTTDAVDGVLLDIVGDANAPAVSYAQNGSYYCFRVQLNGPVTLAQDTVHVLVRQSGSADFYGFSWDYGNGSNSHGLELTTNTGSSTTWGAVTMTDRDGDPAKKQAPDFNTTWTNTSPLPDKTNTTGDGYTLTSSGTVTIGGESKNVTWVDFAIDLNYLQYPYGGSTVTALDPSAGWYLQAATRSGANDHAAFYDVVGSLSASSWSDPVSATPEPTTGFGSACALLCLFLGRRRRKGDPLQTSTASPDSEEQLPTG